MANPNPFIKNAKDPKHVQFYIDEMSKQAASNGRTLVGAITILLYTKDEDPATVTWGSRTFGTVALKEAAHVLEQSAFEVRHQIMVGRRSSPKKK